MNSALSTRPADSWESQPSASVEQLEPESTAVCRSPVAFPERLDPPRLSRQRPLPKPLAAHDTPNSQRLRQAHSSQPSRMDRTCDHDIAHRRLSSPEYLASAYRCDHPIRQPELSPVHRCPDSRLVPGRRDRGLLDDDEVHQQQSDHRQSATSEMCRTADRRSKLARPSRGTDNPEDTCELETCEPGLQHSEPGPANSVPSVHRNAAMRVIR